MDKTALAKIFNRALQLTAQKMELSDSEAMEIADIFEPWTPERRYTAGTKLKYGQNSDGETQLYEVLQDHTSAAEWKPDASPSLYKPVGFSASGYPIWTQPLGAFDAYKKGDTVSYNENLWVSDIDSNVWEPGVYGWSLKK